MTPTQKALVQGFNASLKMRGVCVSLPGCEKLTVLIEPYSPQSERFPVNQSTRTADRIHVLRSDVAELTVQVGTVFKGEAKTYRVVSIDDNPIRVTNIYTCETADVT